MQKLLAVLLAALFAVSTGAIAQDKKKDDKAKSEAKKDEKAKK